MALPQASELNEWAAKIHAHNVAVGWWDNNPSVLEKIHLITTEICEATEGARKDLMDDHLPHRKMEEVELADALIRTLDVGAKLELDIDTLRGNNDDRAPVAVQHLWLVLQVCEFAVAVDDLSMIPVPVRTKARYSFLVSSIILAGTRPGFDIMAAMVEKFEYNKHRADHKREARAQANGKKF